jgi:hypothetical protein
MTQGCDGSLRQRKASPATAFSPVITQITQIFCHIKHKIKNKSN